MKNIVLVGNGAWGKNYVSTIEHSFPTVNLTIADRSNWQSMIDTQPHGVIVATPPESHVHIASYALSKNIPTMIEKPLSLSAKEARELKSYTAPILVNHGQLFTEGYQKLKKLCPVTAIAKIVTMGYSEGPERSYSSLWDYAPHDLAMILDIMGKMPNQIETKLMYDNMYHIGMKFDNASSSTIVGSGGMEKMRNISIEYDGLDLSYDDLSRPSTHIPPLQNAIRVFVDSIDGKLDSRLGIHLSLQVLEILELCDQSLAKQKA